MGTIRNVTKHYGWQGLSIYLQLKIGQTESIHLPGFKNEIRLRKGTDDVKLFKQLLIHQEYFFKAPITPAFIIDAGANIGLSALFFAMQFPQADIVAIEPQQDNYELLLENTKNYPKIKSIKAGLWSKSAILEVTDEEVGSTGFMVKETTAENPKGFRAISADEILTKFEKQYIDLFKVDIEGAEKELLSENVSWLQRTKILIIELHDRKKAGCTPAFFKAFQNLNFECHPFGQNFLLYNKDLL